MNANGWMERKRETPVRMLFLLFWGWWCERDVLSVSKGSWRGENLHEQRRLRADGTGGFDTHTHRQSPDYFRRHAHASAPPHTLSTYNNNWSSSITPQLVSDIFMDRGKRGEKENRERGPSGFRTLLIYPSSCRSDIHPSDGMYASEWCVCVCVCVAVCIRPIFRRDAGRPAGISPLSTNR